MNKRVSLVLVLLMSLPCGLLAADHGRIAIYADEARSVSDVFFPGSIHQFDIYIFCLPGEDGLMCAEFAVDYPGNVITTQATGNPGLSVSLGDLESGMSTCFLDCRDDWVWTHVQTLFLTDGTPSRIEIVPHPASGEYQFTNCLPGFPIEQVLYSNPLFLNETFVADESPPVVVSTECVNQNRFMVHFDEPLFDGSVMRMENYTLIRFYTTGDTLTVFPATLANDDSTIVFVTPDTLVHGEQYRLEYADVTDKAGNLAGGVTWVEGLDTYPPTFTVCEIDRYRMWVKVRFSEEVQAGPAEDQGNYWAKEGSWTSGPTIYCNEAILEPDGRTVQVIFPSEFKADVNYVLVVRDVLDLAGNEVDEHGFAPFQYRDLYPPAIIDVEAPSCYYLSIRFDEAVDTTSALDPANYEVLEGGDPGESIGVYKVIRDVEGEWFYLSLVRAVAEGQDHILRYGNICDTLQNCVGSEEGEAGSFQFGYIDEVATLVQCHSARHSSEGIVLSWTLSEVIDASEMSVSRSVAGAGSFAPVQGPVIVQDGLTCRFVDSDVARGGSYRYRVSLHSGDGVETLFETEEISVPHAELFLGTNKPNPFNPFTEIAYSLPVAGHVRMEIYDVAGRRVRILIDGFMPAGTHETAWDGLDDSNTPVTSGVYFYRIVSGKSSISKKMVLLR